MNARRNITFAVLLLLCSLLLWGCQPPPKDNPTQSLPPESQFPNPNTDLLPESVKQDILNYYSTGGNNRNVQIETLGETETDHFLWSRCEKILCVRVEYERKKPEMQGGGYTVGNIGSWIVCKGEGDYWDPRHGDELSWEDAKCTQFGAFPDKLVR